MHVLSPAVEQGGGGGKPGGKPGPCYIQCMHRSVRYSIYGVCKKICLFSYNEIPQNFGLLLLIGYLQYQHDHPGDYSPFENNDAVLA